MDDDDAAARSSQEIKALLKKLDPSKSSHKDRIRRLNKFRNFVTGKEDVQPEFYDDDIPLLLLGSAAPSALLGDDPELMEGDLHGLLQACGAPSVEHDQMLKRSARHAMSLLKFLVCDFVEDGTEGNVDLTKQDHASSNINLFAQSFCALPIQQYQHMSLDLHMIGDQRGGAKEDACHVMVYLLTQHVSEDGETMSPLSKEDLLASSSAQQAFDYFLTQTVDQEVRNAIKRNAQLRADLEKQDMIADRALGRLSDDDDQGLGGVDGDDEIIDEEDDQDGYDHDDGGALAGLRRRRKAAKKELLEATKTGDLEEMKGPALRWEDSQLYREQRARQAAHERMQQDGEFHDNVRDSQKAAMEIYERENEKAKVMRRDPLGLKDDKFDLRTIQNNQVDYLEQALLELNEELRKGEAGGEIEPALHAKKESLESILDGIVGMSVTGSGMNSSGKIVGSSLIGAISGRSTLPTDPNFDPLLFLTLVHRKASYEELVGSMDRLSNDTANQVSQLQNMVRENFALFLRCADGIDVFNEKTISQSGPGLIDRLNRLDAMAESCSHQAKKSFKPLLDNASEVRKVQSALVVLSRVAPVLQAPYLMRQHVENGRFSAALKSYRRVLVIDEHCNIHLLNHVKAQAAECAREARRELEGRLAQDTLSVASLLDAIRDLAELLELDIPVDPREAEKVNGSNYRNKPVGVFEIGELSINIRDHPPALACLMLQAAHFSFLVSRTIDEADSTTSRIFEGESLAVLENDQGSVGGDSRSVLSGDKSNDASPSQAPSTIKSAAGSNQWKYDVLEARGLATIKAVEVVRLWLPRLLHIAKAAREDEKRRSARVVRKRSSIQFYDNQLTPFEVILTNIGPTVARIVDHATFCSLGSAPRGSGMDVKLTFGKKAPEKLKALLRSPLPPSQSARVGKELAELVEILNQGSNEVSELRPTSDTMSIAQISPLDDSKILGEQAVMTIEKRRCIYAFDICARTCSSRASGSGKFDADSLISCLKVLSEELTRPEQCANEVEKGCELVIRKCCDGLASYVRDRGDDARLSVVAECADVLLERIVDVVREVGYLTNNAEAVEDAILEDIMGLESAIFDEFLENIRASVASCCQIPTHEAALTDDDMNGGSSFNTIGFPSYLSASLLAIVRCRAQVEQALGDKIRRSEGVTYLQIAMGMISEGVVEAICNQIERRKMSLKLRSADRLANELQFLMNTLKSNLGDEALKMLDATRLMLCAKAGRGNGIQGAGPDGLAALEDLERLGRVYVLCLGE